MSTRQDQTSSVTRTIQSNVNLWKRTPWLWPFWKLVKYSLRDLNTECSCIRLLSHQVAELERFILFVMQSQLVTPTVPSADTSGGNSSLEFKATKAVPDRPKHAARFITVSCWAPPLFLTPHILNAPSQESQWMRKAGKSQGVYAPFFDGWNLKNRHKNATSIFSGVNQPSQREKFASPTCREKCDILPYVTCVGPNA